MGLPRNKYCQIGISGIAGNHDMFPEFQELLEDAVEDSDKFDEVVVSNTNITLKDHGRGDSEADSHKDNTEEVQTDGWEDAMENTKTVHEAKQLINGHIEQCEEEGKEPQLAAIKEAEKATQNRDAVVDYITEVE